MAEEKQQPLDKNSELYFRWAMLKENGPEFFAIAQANIKQYGNTSLGDNIREAVKISGLFVDAFVAQNGTPWATPSEVIDGLP